MSVVKAWLPDFDEQIANEIYEANRKPVVYAYTAADLSAAVSEARQEGYAEGYEEGKSDSLIAHEATSISAVEKAFNEFAANMASCVEVIAQKQAAIEADAVDFISSVFDKLLPRIVRETHSQLMKETLKDAVRMALGHPKLEVYAGKTAYETIKGFNIKHIIPTEQDIAFELILDETKPNMSFTAAWVDGKCEVDAEALASDIIRQMKS